MLQFVSALNPAELVIFAVAVIGLLPVIAYYRTETRLFVFAYAFLVAGAIATNVENLILPDVINFLEHTVGILGAGAMFAVAAYLRRKDVLGADDRINAESTEG